MAYTLEHDDVICTCCNFRPVTVFDTEDSKYDDENYYNTDYNNDNAFHSVCTSCFEEGWRNRWSEPGHPDDTVTGYYADRYEQCEYYNINARRNPPRRARYVYTLKNRYLWLRNF